MLRTIFIALAAASLLSTVARADVKIVTDVAPVHSLLAQVTEGIDDPFLLMSGPASPHDFALKPSQARMVEEADLIVWIGPNLTPQLEDAFASLGQSAQSLLLANVGGTHHRNLREDAIFEIGDTAAHQHEHEHETEADDPHLWLDPDNAVVWVDAIVDALVSLNPDDASVYQANARSAKNRLKALGEKIEVQLDGAHPSFIVAHDALIHFEDRFDVPAIGALSGSDANAPGPRRVAAIQDALEDRNVACILNDVSEPSQLSRSLTSESVKLLDIDPLGATLEPGPRLYEELLGQLATSILECQAR